MSKQAVLKASQEDLSFLDKASNLTKQERIGAWVGRIFIWVVIAITMFPVVAVVSASLADGEVFIQKSVFPENFTFNNYVSVIKDTDFLEWMKNSLIVCTTVACIQLALAVPAAYAFSKLKFIGRRNGLMSLMLLQIFPTTMALPAILGIVYRFGGMDKLWVLILIISGGNAYNIWLLKGFMDGIPKELSEAALVDGASTWQVFTRIILPLTRNMLIVIFLFSFIAPYSEFIYSAALIKDPSALTLPLGMELFIKDKFSTNWSSYSAAAIMSSLPIVMMFMASQKYIAKGLTAGSVKG
ncbi:MULTISPECIES: sugar ABC transporter permease [Zhenhengia]|jgi:arabinogalactan oligomer/maltooligosaccharide transport system permease protein|uniref:sugar ABC transporter permease n=1 Tax=Zhenhengia TaxID=2944196 RepID=UPI001B439CA1|nr:sugar ABC transporter permease [Zhenhengia yiwuensis]MBP3911235.1 sugar ABC transporter permease [Niameybacter sp.]MBS5800950.1 sugar ABC transporter permease [Clostridiales bacterium]MDU6359235.1 sugar ABC transporter permease [Clostridiales bacterium]MDY3368514.1 sugar ABC transporter permease [Zhenhengia yiwuensis]